MLTQMASSNTTEEVPMDWIEQYFGLNPDGGSGSFEAAIMASAVLLVGALVVTVSRPIRRRVTEAGRRIAHRLNALLSVR